MVTWLHTIMTGHITMDDFLVRALLAGIVVAVVAGPLGTFVVWRRMAYFGATLSHSALLGVALGLLLGMIPGVGVLVVCLGVALFLAFEGRQEKPKSVSEDSLLGVVAHGTLALGLVSVAFIDGVRFDLMAYLFGDILAVTRSDLYWLCGGTVLVGTTLSLIWRPLLSATVHEEIARVEGVPVARVKLIHMLLLAAAVALAMKVVGVLLVTSMLMIPAAAARPLAKSPEGMAMAAVVIGCLSVIGGLGASMTLDTPSGPSIVVVSFLAFIFIRTGAAALSQDH